MKPVMNAFTKQQELWDQIFTESESYFGEQPSLLAQKSLELFRENNVCSVLESGCGQGRDTFLFAQDGIKVTALDYSTRAVDEISAKATSSSLSSYIDSRCFDIRKPLPFESESFDACYSHMLLCMELTMAEISCALSELHRVLKPGGLAVYSVRSIFDRHYRAGDHLGENLYEVGKFAVHFFSEDKLRGLASGFKIKSIERIEEGALPRDLFCIVMEKCSTRYAPTFESCSGGNRQTDKVPFARNRAHYHCPGGT
ncbi:class I SAM-dependent methyltransferase [Maridesulfovibrio salexigens]|uniref:Methyltransferase type 11 n=1 Tax=Maridesulfovibrio salexigens (strain ATCC 14822 / DSM 2638 / NCIMB 8403 / VKM B-1763) TaxID=526222 RepID=C6BSS1_MARSD|nr:class I SAM-dependent methyltransferase [Maridesulfovibrio salexigens]ACS81527.1 Methyltransferase type 11 [Maridesulfovibrio salexigens DSM 2638]